MSHPLLNPDSAHYAMCDGVEAIERMEQMYSIDELAAWAKITSTKYRLRIGKKDAIESEVKKIKTYEAYYKYLMEQRELLEGAEHSGDSHEALYTRQKLSDLP